MKREFSTTFHRKPRFFLLLALLLGLCHAQRGYSETYSLGVGESVTISQAAYGGGYIDRAALADYLDPHLKADFSNGLATITVQSYFTGTITVKLVFVERYRVYGRMTMHPYYKDVYIKCSSSKPTGKKVTKVMLPDRVRIPLQYSGRYKLTPVFEPYDATPTAWSWYHDIGTSTFVFHKYSDVYFCEIKPRSPGVGRAYILINNDENLYASTVVEIYDENNPPPTNVVLPSSIEISRNGHATLTPLLIPEGSATTYTWSSSNESVATVSYGKVTGKSTGTTTITLKTGNNLTATCKVTVVSYNGADDEDAQSPNQGGGTVGGHDYVDLGLSVKWATCNVGASSPEDFGGYYAWGETSEKSTYTWENYSHCGGSVMSVYNIGSDIKKTNYDVAYKKWGSSWRMPNEAEVGELIAKCSISSDRLNGVNGYTVTGPNGNSIFIPTAGKKRPSGMTRSCEVWSSTVSSGGDNAETMLLSSKSTIATNMRCFGIPVRAVTEASSSSQVDPTGISISPSSAQTIKVGGTLKASYTLTPSNATTTVTWSSDNKNVATVDQSGNVKGVGVGSTYINVTTSNGKTAWFKISVEVSSPNSEAGEAGVIAVSAGDFHSLIVKKDGSLWACGNNWHGQLGDGTTTNRHTPVKIMDNVSSVSAGGNHSLIVKKDGSLWACGYNEDGELGDGTTTERHTPVKIMDDVSSVSAGGYHSLIVKKDGSLWACGDNEYGQLGDGTGTDRHTPVKIMDNVSSVSAGNYHSLIVKKDGSLWACGNNKYGRLGDGTTTDRHTPVKIMDNVSSASAGYDYSLIVKKDGSLWACGYNGHGELGDGTTTDKHTPVKIMDNVSSVSGGGGHSLIVKKDGSLWACGYNGSGRLGDGTTTNRHTPVKIMDNVSSVSAGFPHSLIVKKDGSLWACGSNGQGQLGDGTTTGRYTPVKIIDGVSTSIEPIVVNRQPQAVDAIYSLSGQRLKAPRKGVNIIGGRKVVVK